MTDRMHIAPYGAGLTPLLSIMIPTYRRPDLLAEAIRSCVTQVTTLSFEIVVVDNESEPETARRVDDVVAREGAGRVQVVRNPRNLGMFGNWNQCLRLARARHVTVLNDDDLLRPDFVETVKPYLVRQELITVRCSTLVHGSPLRRRMSERIVDAFQSRPIEKLGLADLVIDNPNPGSLGIVWNRDEALNLGGFPETYWPSADYVLLVRYAEKRGILRIRHVCACYRIAENESLKVPALEGFLRRSFLIRGRLRRLILPGPRRRAFQRLSAYQTVLRANQYRAHVNLQFDPHRALRGTGLEFRPMRLLRLRGWSLRVVWRLLLAGSRVGPDRQKSLNTQ